MPEQTQFVEFEEVEQIVSAAGNYVEVTDDLRAETLEVARNECRQRSNFRWIAALAVAIIFVAVTTGQFRGERSSTLSLHSGMTWDATEICAAALQDTAGADGECRWALVDAFKSVRQRQASLIEDAFLHFGASASDMDEASAR